MNMVVLARRVVLLILIALLTIPLIAQTRWYDPLKENYDVIQNQGWTREIGNMVDKFIMLLDIKNTNFFRTLLGSLLDYLI